MIVAEQPKREYEVRTYVVPLCQHGHGPMKASGTSPLVRYFRCATCGATRRLPRTWIPPSDK